LEIVRVHAAGVNPVDAMNRESGLFIGEPPFVLGWDVSGTVEAVGLGVTLYALGDEVFGMLPFPHGRGAYAQYVVAPTRVFVRKPPRIQPLPVGAENSSGPVTCGFARPVGAGSAFGCAMSIV
jgi:NADPH:quinone reductase-like Zn-dependent oxidoreductase